MGRLTAKVSSDGTGLNYSSYAGGMAEEQGIALAVDGNGDAYVAGFTKSADFVATPGAFQTKIDISPRRAAGFILKTGQLRVPRITGASIQGKKLRVAGDEFADSAVILVDGRDVMTNNSADNAHSLLVAPKAGRDISAGETVRLQVRNPDGRISTEFAFTRR